MRVAIVPPRAAALGLRTAYVRRPREWGDRAGREEPPERRYDLRVDGVDELAERLARG